MQHRMPVAALAIEPGHRLMPEPPAAVSGALTCPETGSTCPALAALFANHAPEDGAATTWIRALAPCGQCRVAAEGSRDRLRRVRLGRRERDILCAAATSALGEALVLTSKEMSRSESASRRRAAQTLTKAGLVAPATAGSADGTPRAAIALTAFGAYVMAAYGRYVMNAKPVRWTRPARGVPLPGLAPSDLAGEVMSRAHTALRDTLRELTAVLSAALAGRLSDPARLDHATRHLEAKATLLKAVLAPGRSTPA